MHTEPKKIGHCKQPGLLSFAQTDRAEKQAMFQPMRPTGCIHGHITHTQRVYIMSTKLNVISSINYSSNDSDAAVLTNEINCTANPAILRQIAAQSRVISSAASVELWVQSAPDSDVYVNVDSGEQRELYAQRSQYHATRRSAGGEIGEGLIERAKKMLALHSIAVAENAARNAAAAAGNLTQQESDNMSNEYAMGIVGQAVYGLGDSIEAACADAVEWLDEETDAERVLEQCTRVVSSHYRPHDGERIVGLREFVERHCTH